MIRENLECAEMPTEFSFLLFLNHYLEVEYCFLKMKNGIIGGVMF